MLNRNYWKFKDLCPVVSSPLGASYRWSAAGDATHVVVQQANSGKNENIYTPDDANIPIITTRIKSPSTKVAFFEGSWAWPVSGVTATSLSQYLLYGDNPPASTSYVAYRHAAAANIAFFDGHVESRKEDTLKDSSTGSNLMWYYLK